MKAKTEKDIYIVVVNNKQFEVKDGVIEFEEEFKEAIFSHGFIELLEEQEEIKPVKKGRKNG